MGRRADGLNGTTPGGGVKGALPARGPALSVEGLVAGYRGRAVLRGVTLSVSQGAVVGLVGPNGCGKTTLFRVVSGVLRPAAGRVWVAGRDLAPLGLRERARLVAVTPQTAALPPRYTALQVVLMGRTPHLRLLAWEGAHDGQVARQAMVLTETWHLAGRPVGELSGGERQRVLLARALAQEAPLLLLDEPTASLDLTGQTMVLEAVLRAQQEQGGTVLLATHDLTLAATVCHRLVLLHDGQVLAEGTPREVLTGPLIAQAYGVQVEVVQHPRSGTPVVLHLAGGTLGDGVAAPGGRKTSPDGPSAHPAGPEQGV
ncbi:MAG: ABC transporter ATP-binding protein [Chloroflexi bacterium]|nr:ABC transporter ATP-binding protein [Chloroflexota bacterium]